MRKDEEPGFRPGAAPGAMPRSRETITGVEAFAAEMRLTPADARRLRSEGFISFTVQPIRGPRARPAHERRPVRDRGRRQAQTWRTSCARTSSARIGPSRTSGSSASRAFRARAAGPHPSRPSATSTGCRVGACSSWGTRAPVPSSAHCRKACGRSMSARTGSARSKAEGVGFEPTRDLTAPNGFRDRPVQPLRHPSGTTREFRGGK